MGISCKMEFERPSKGNLKVDGKHKIGEKSYLFDLVTQFDSDTSNAKISQHFQINGDAETGIVNSILPQDKTEKLEVKEVSWSEIQESMKSLGHSKVCEMQKEGFVALSEGEVCIPEVIYMPFADGDLHLKGAHKSGGEIYVLKIATGCPKNEMHGLAPNQGVMIAFDAKTGEPLLILKDEGNLTDLRTAISGRIAAEALMPATQLHGIGVLGTGVQARLQVQQLKSLYPNCRKLTVWGRTKGNVDKYVQEMKGEGWEVTIVASPKLVAEKANLIITTTASKVALLDEDDITDPNTLIIGIGADMPGKLELSANLLKKAESVIIDSIEQGKDHGNAADALKNKIIQETDLQEFGDLLKNGLKNPKKANRLRIFLSSGVGVQDLQIVQAVIEGVHLEKEENFDEVPKFSDEKIARTAMTLYGIEGEISLLNAFEDQNALIKTANGRFVLKISNKKIPFDDLNGQNLLLRHLKNTTTEIKCPEVVLTKSGKSITMVDGFAVRMLSFIQGNILGTSARSTVLDHNIGQYLGKFSNAVQSFKQSVLEKPNDFWNLDNVLACRAFVDDVKDEQIRALVNSFFIHYENNVLPKISGLRKGVIHGDANEQNILIGIDESSEVTGLIDFGDMQWATQINDLAICMAYALLDVKDIESTAREIVNGYDKEFPIENTEFEVLSDLIIMRLITSVVLTSNRAKQYPENTYIICSQEPASNLLKKLEKLDFKVPFGYPELK